MQQFFLSSSSLFVGCLGVGFVKFAVNDITFETWAAAPDQLAPLTSCNKRRASLFDDMRRIKRMFSISPCGYINFVCFHHRLFARQSEIFFHSRAHFRDATSIEWSRFNSFSFLSAGWDGRILIVSNQGLRSVKVVSSTRLLYSGMHKERRKARQSYA